jgi:transposase
MVETRRKLDQDFKEGAVRLVRETGKTIAQVARDLGINEGTLGNWVNADRRRRGDGTGALDEDERAELTRLRREDADLAMERDVLIGHVERRVRARRSGRLVMSSPRGPCLRPAHLGVSGPPSMPWWPRVGRGSSPPAG